MGSDEVCAAVEVGVARGEVMRGGDGRGHGVARSGGF